MATDLKREGEKVEGALKTPTPDAVRPAFPQPARRGPVAGADLADEFAAQPSEMKPRAHSHDLGPLKTA